MRDVPSHGVYFCTYDWVREQLEPGSREAGSQSHAAALVAGGTPTQRPLSTAAPRFLNPRVCPKAKVMWLPGLACFETDRPHKCDVSLKHHRSRHCSQHLTLAGGCACSPLLHFDVLNSREAAPWQAGWQAPLHGYPSTL